MPKTKKLSLSIIPGIFGICHLAKNSEIPEWTKSFVGFCSITRTDDELSIVLPQDKIPAGVMAEKGWQCFKVKGPLDLSLTGIVSSLAGPLAKAKISIFYISTYETDYLMVEEKNFSRAKKILVKTCNIIE